MYTFLLILFQNFVQSDTESLPVNPRPQIALRWLSKRLFLLLMLLFLQIIPVVFVVLIMTVNVEGQLQTTPSSELANTSLGRFGKCPVGFCRQFLLKAVLVSLYFKDTGHY